MDWIADALGAWGRSAGMDRLALDERGCISFEVEGERLLTIMDLGASGGDELLVMLRTNRRWAAAGSARAALALADFRRATGPRPQVSMDGDQLVATLRIDRHSFLASTLDEAVASLFDFHERVTKAEAAR